EQPVSLIDYYTNDEFRKFSLIDVILKYTIGLPGTLKMAMNGKQPDVILPGDSTILTLSRQEDRCMRILKDKVTLNVNEKEGTIDLTAVMPEPLAVAQVASAVQGMLQRYITEFKIEKAQAKLGFIEKRYVDAKKQFEVKQEELAQFRDANRNFASAIAKATEERLSNEYTVALGVYSELAKQREQANIQVKEDTPIFTIVEPVTVPNEPFKPKRALILIAFVFLGGFVGIGLVLVLPFVAQISGNKHLQNWLPEGEA
ncbi:MAG: lipopolysaccharide biosynthesis protein, partial [Odoribacter sp.]|nr:lipopolysaccharide biosynthesis protein [Odoribacter sp.]